MKVFGTKRLEQFAKRRQEIRSALQNWLVRAEESNCDDPHCLREAFPKARCVHDIWWFKINPGAYRLKTKIDFDKGVIAILKILTHDDYIRECN